ncbi:putative membrane protein [Escherichia coli EC4402]|nr:putative membrane protein [Escherichia coli EC4402]
MSGAADHPACGVIVILRVSGLFQPVASGILVSLFTYPVPARRLRLQVATAVIAIGLIAFAIAQPGA